MQAHGALAVLTIKVHMEVGEGVFVFFATSTVLLAKRKLGLSATVLHLVHEVLFQKEV
jgi:hypothetical protein